MSEFDRIGSSEIEHQIEVELRDTDKVGPPLVRNVLQEPRDRWYGQLAVRVYDSLSEHKDYEDVLPAAAAIELLRESVRLRSRLLVTLTDKHAHSLTLEPTAALLAGDYFYTAAFSSLRSVPDSRSGDCFEILTAVLETITGTFARAYTPDKSVEYDKAVFLDETAGSLGEGAAILGGTFAGLDEPNHRHFERLGRELSVVRQIRLILDADPSEATVVPPAIDQEQLRALAERRQDHANRVLDTLSETVDVTRLRAFAEATTTVQDEVGSATDGDALD
ncbi:isoprenoid biosynthesis enzyme family protein [Halorussus litoreus]|uniref:polyprenyl synthetase n=1 Tax=Halorussus litoreus TaxID=1710536 RepID=UPI000E247A11|nr:polyprenyl synthetase [Halorussus litoreus]